MNNLWPDRFEANDNVAPKKYIETQASYLEKITGGKVYAEVLELSPMDAIGSMIPNDFSYRFDIKAKFLPNYVFNILMFSHDITMYPVKFRLDQKLGEEIGVKKSNFGGYYLLEVQGPNELESFLATALGSKRISNIVGSIISLSN